MFRVRTHIAGGPMGPSLSTMFFDSTGGGSAAAANALVHAWWENWKATVLNGVTFTTDAQVDTVDPATGQITASTAVTPLLTTGTAGGDPLPWEVQGLIQWRTGVYVTGRELRGRTFIPGLVTTQTAGGAPTAALKTAANGWAAALIADITADLIIYSREKHTFATATSGTLWNVWAGLRSRRQ